MILFLRYKEDIFSEVRRTCSFCFFCCCEGCVRERVKGKEREREGSERQPYVNKDDKGCKNVTEFYIHLNRTKPDRDRKKE